MVETKINSTGIETEGELTVKDSGSNGSITKRSTVNVLTGGKFILDGGTIDASGHKLIADVEVSDGGNAILIAADGRGGTSNIKAQSWTANFKAGGNASAVENYGDWTVNFNSDLKVNAETASGKTINGLYVHAI